MTLPASAAMRGPGERQAILFSYRSIEDRIPSDSLITFEPGSQRVQRWTPAGEFVSLKPLTSPEGRGTAWLVGLLGDGSLLLSNSVPDEAQNTALTTRNRVSLFRASGIGEPWDSLFSFGGRVSIRHPQNPSWTFGSPIFAPAASWAQRAGRIAFTAGDRFEIEIRNSEGRLRMIVRRAAPPRTVSGAEFERALSGWVEGLPADRKEQILPRLREISTNRIRPAVSEVGLASNGRIWVTFGDPAIGERVQASVFDSLGRWESDVTVPVGVQINQVDSDGLLGTVTDGEGFRHIRFYRLRRAAP